MAKRISFLPAMVVGTVVFLSGAAHAIDLGPNGEYGQINGDFRAREEVFDRGTKPDTANASTARLRLGYMTPVYEGLSGYIEGETIQYIGNDNFDDGQNHKTKYPAVNDPRDNALNQLYLSYKLPGTGDSAVVGRQVIRFDNDRFIGRSNWRQNDTTQDGAHLTVQPVKNLTLDYAYSDDAHRSLGTRETLGEYKGNMNMFHGTYGLPSDVKVSAYSYLLDFDPYVRSGATASTQLSSDTYGGRMEWKPKVVEDQLVPYIVTDTAYQTNGDNSTNNLSEWYGWYELGGNYEGYTLSGVFEQLGGNGHAAIQTPLASLHSFNGWAEKFSTKPVNGLDDYFMNFKAPIPLPFKDQKLTFESQLHQYNAEAIDQDYGREVDMGLTYNPVENQTIALQGARYWAEHFSDDTTKIYLYYEVKF